MIECHSTRPEFGHFARDGAANFRHPIGVASRRKMIAHGKRNISTNVHLLGGNQRAAGLRDITSSVRAFPREPKRNVRTIRHRIMF